MARCHISYLMLLLHCVLKITQAIDATEFSKEIHLTQDSLRVSSLAFQGDKGFRYTTCDTVTDSDIYRPNLVPYPASLNCTLHLLTPDRDRTCNVSLSMSDGSRFIEKVKFEPLTKDKILVLSDEDAHDDDSTAINRHFFAIVNFDDCSYRSLNFPPNIHLYDLDEDVTIHPDHFQLKLYNKDSMCGSLDRCKIAFDIDGNKVGEPVPIPFEYFRSYGIPASIGSPNRGSFAYGHSDLHEEHWHATYTSANGTLEFVANFSSIRVPEGPNHYRSEVKPKWPSMVSSARDLYGLCGEVTTDDDTQRFWCLQYDWKTGQSANFTFEESSVARRDKSLFKIVSFANLGMGSILFINIECPEESVCEKFHVSTVNQAGQVEEKVSTPMHLECPNFYKSVKAAVVEVENDFCFKFTCVHNIEYPAELQLNIFMKCISKSQV